MKPTEIKTGNPDDVDALQVTSSRFSALRAPIDAAEAWLNRLKKDAREAGFEWREPEIIDCVGRGPEVQIYWPVVDGRQAYIWHLKGRPFEGKRCAAGKTFVASAADPAVALSLYRWLVTGEGP